MEYLDRPRWSAFREPSFGHGLLLLQNTTHAAWRWHRNQVCISLPKLLHRPIHGPALYLLWQTGPMIHAASEADLSLHQARMLKRQPKGAGAASLC